MVTWAMGKPYGLKDQINLGNAVARCTSAMHWPRRVD